MITGLIFAIVPLLIVLWEARRSTHLGRACGFAWFTTLFLCWFVALFQFSIFFLFTPFVLAVLVTLSLFLRIDPYRLVWPTLAIAGVGCAMPVVVGDQPPGPPVYISPDRLPETDGTEDLPAAPFYPDGRLFFGTYGTGLDPDYLVKDLPSHVQTLPEIHQRYVTNFVRKPNAFGDGRYSWHPELWVELLVANPAGLSSPGFGEKVYPGRAALTTTRSNEWIWDHRPKYNSKLRTLAFRTFEVRDVPKRVWAIGDQQLVSLLKPSSPFVYVHAPLDLHVSRKRDKKSETDLEDWPRPVRELDRFEESALQQLRQGNELVVRTTLHEMRLLGAVRARIECISCHGCEEGELLGAFTYTLTPSRRELLD